MDVLVKQDAGPALEPCPSCGKSGYGEDAAAAGARKCVYQDVGGLAQSPTARSAQDPRVEAPGQPLSVRHHLLWPAWSPQLAHTRTRVGPPVAVLPTLTGPTPDRLPPGGRQAASLALVLGHRTLVVQGSERALGRF